MTGLLVLLHAEYALEMFVPFINHPFCRIENWKKAFLCNTSTTTLTAIRKKTNVQNTIIYIFIRLTVYKCIIEI